MKAGPRAAALALALAALAPLQAPFGAAGAADEAAEFDRYRKQAAKLKEHRDGDGLDERPVLQVLDSAGIFGWAENGSFAKGFRPFQVRVYNGLWRWPLKAGIVSSEFGRRWGKRHHGIDIAADPGVPVLAAAAGTVLYADDGLKGYGNVVILRHDQKTTTLYAHNETLEVKAGQQVKAGQLIATLGSTGRSTGPHVHFELRVKERAVDPRRRLVKSRF